ncbi:MAG: transporter substrate-binding domain-containing protein [Muribaculaceae bacterium]|nr:transporter substrate-binding domain-containing protein [Muribaculaceae bacterium]
MRLYERFAAWAAVGLTLMTAGCGGGKADSAPEREEHRLPDTLRVATLYSPTSYFIYRDEPMGYDYSLLTQMAEDKGMAVDLKVAPSLQKMMEMLDSGEVDLVAYEIPVTAEFKEKVAACGPESMTHQVLVQPRKAEGHELITDETELVGKDVYVESQSKYLYRLQNLNEELGGGINIHVIDRDTLITEDLIEMVSKGEIPLTIVDSDIARINQTYYSDLDISLPLSFPQKARWGVRPDEKWLADSIDDWFGQEEPKEKQAKLLKRYFELSKRTDGVFNIDLSKGRVSPYDHLFKRYGGELGVDWRLLASQGYHESRFDPTRVSWAGARGVMQIMPRTARAYGLASNKMADPEANIATATKIWKDLDRSLSKRVSDPEERKKFVLAAYNGGLAHVLDAIALAKKYGKNPQVWTGNVEEALKMKANPEYYTDPVVKAGYFRGRETVAYVNGVMKFYNNLKKKVEA